MARVLSTAVVLALLAATAVAFAVTEGAKLTKSPITATYVSPIFSPAGKAKPTAEVRFRLRTSQRLTVWIEDSKGRNVATLLPVQTVRRGRTLKLEWDGVTSSGAAAPDGVYQPIVKLEHSHLKITLPNLIRLDTKPPVIAVRHTPRAIISPDGDGHRDSFRVAYHLSEPAHAILLVRGVRVNFTLYRKLTGVLVWNGRLKDRAGVPTPARPGVYVLSVAAQDTAGNVSKPYPFALVQVRYVTLARRRVDVGPRKRFAIRVSTDAPQVAWRLHGRSGVERAGTLRFRAPAKRGVYHLYVTVANHSATCEVVVR